MSLVVNNNMMAANTARNLNAHYGRLATSTQRLSSGLRVNSAADDAAGLAIRELQRADIAALQQGARNANDAISMIQVADGSLGIIDEKLIRMKELAEQAATGTYDSTQRLMIESEYQAMASEITRIANATDFNGTKLLDGTLAGDHDGSGLISEGKMKIHFGTGNDSAEDYYYVEIGECTSEALGLGNNSTWQDVQRRGLTAFKDSLLKQIKNNDTLTDEDKGKLTAAIDKMAKRVGEAIDAATSPAMAYELWSLTDGDPAPDAYKVADDEGFLKGGKSWIGNSDLLSRFLAAGSAQSAQDALTYEAYMKAKGAEMSPEAAKANDYADWSIAQKALQDSAIISEDDIFAEWKKSANAKALLTTAAKADAQGWADALAAVGVTDDKIFAAWETVPANATTLTTAAKADTQSWADAVATAAAADANVTDAAVLAEWAKGANAATFAQNNDPTGWAAATTAAGAGADDAAILAEWVKDTTNAVAFAKNDKANWTAATETVLNDDGAVLAEWEKANPDKAMAVAKADTTGWAAATTDAATAANVTDDDVLAEWEKANPDKAMAAAKADTNATTGWDAVEQGIRDNLTFTNKEIYAQYLSDKDAQPDAISAKLNDPADWKAAEADVPLADRDEASAKALDNFWQGLRETERQKLQYAFGQAALYNLANAPTDNEPEDYGLHISPELDFGTLAGLDDPDAQETAEGILTQALKDMQAKVGHMNFAGHTVETQEDAQMALDAINDAIVSKDKIRAHLGAAQNRLENTVSNLNIQAENLQAAESRISDVDVATEMTEFVRNQILTQSAVAMLSQANSLPQMAMQLIGG